MKALSPSLVILLLSSRQHQFPTPLLVRNNCSMLSASSVASRRTFFHKIGTPLSMSMAAYASSSVSSSSTAQPYSPTPKSISIATTLLNSVYGDASSSNFPLPMQSFEAGPCNYCSNKEDTTSQQHSVSMDRCIRFTILSIII